MRRSSTYFKTPLSFIILFSMICSLTAAITGCNARTPGAEPETAAAAMSASETSAPTSAETASALETSVPKNTFDASFPEETISETAGFGTSTPEAASVKTSVTKTTFPVTVTDQLGREVVIQEKPKTIISGYYISTSLLIALGEADSLAGVEAQAGKRPVYGLAAPVLLTLPGVGTVKELDLELCAALEPDLVIVPAKLKEKIPAMEELGLTVLAVNPENRELLKEMTALLGTATGNQETAQRLTDATDSLLDKLQAALEPELAEGNKPSVYLGGNSSFFSTAGPAMFQHSLIEQAGGRNVAEVLSDTYWAKISYEQLLAWDPEYIILTANAAYSVDSVLADEQLADCRAVKNGCVYQIPGDIEAWDSPVPGSVLGSLWLASILHPEACPTDLYQQAVTAFYEEFYGFTPEM